MGMGDSNVCNSDAYLAGYRAGWNDALEAMARFIKRECSQRATINDFSTHSTEQRTAKLEISGSADTPPTTPENSIG